MAAPIRSERLILVPATADLIEAELAGLNALANALDASVGEEWFSLTTTDVLPLFASQLRALPELVGWLEWYVLLPVGEERFLIGNADFKGPPDDIGEVEIGYEMLAQYQGRGYATETVKALVGWALKHGDVVAVTAQCIPDNAASIRVLEKSGFIEVGEGIEEGTRMWEYDPDSCGSGYMPL